MIPEPITEQSPTIENQPLRGVTIRIIASIIISTAISVGTVTGFYWEIKNKDSVQDLQLETIRLQVEQIKIDLRDHQQQLNNKKDK